MSGMRDESLTLDDIIDAAQLMVSIGQIVKPGYLGAERAVNEQLLWNCMVLGEASKRLSPATRTRFADVGWSDMARTRDRITHHYDIINWPVMAQIITEELPPLIPRLVEIRDILRLEFDAEEPPAD